MYNLVEIARDYIDGIENMEDMGCERRAGGQKNIVREEGKNYP